MNNSHAVDLGLVHRADVGKVAQYLTHALDCDYWYAVHHSEHQLVLHLSGNHIDRYAVSFECTAPVEKGVYHGSMTSHFAIVPLPGQPDLPPETLDEIKAGIGHL